MHPLTLTLGSAVMRAWSPARLYAAGEQGAWYDPSDMSTLFQDAAGTTPITAVGQPVGLVLDKSRGLVLGPELVTNGTFDTDAGWALGTGWGISNGSLNWQNGYNRAGFLVGAGAFIVGKTYKVTGVISNYTGGSVVAYLAIPGNPKRATAEIKQNGKFTVYLSPIETVTSFGFEGVAATGSMSIDNISVRELPGNHARQTDSAKRPTYMDVDGRRSLYFAGAQALVTSAINFTGTDKMTVFAGVRKISDAAVGIVTELSASSNAGNAGSFYLCNADVSGRLWSSASVGVGSLTLALGAYDVTAAPDTAVMSATHDIAGDLSTLRRNGVAGISGTADKGTGAFGSYPLYIGARAGSSLFFNGHLYGLAVRGAATSAADIARAEAWLNRKTGAY